MDLLHSWGVELTVHLQTRYSRYEGLFNLASAVADLHTTFFLPVPCLVLRAQGHWGPANMGGCHRRLAQFSPKMGSFWERPYWWVHETQFYRVGKAPLLKQFPITCETGPGSPSGHAMGVAGVWYVMVTALLSIAKEKHCPNVLYRLLQIGLWALMVLVVLIVCMSRVFMAAHFPHQVIAGVITGIVVAGIVSKKKWIYNASMSKYLHITLFLAFFAIGFYVLLKIVGVDLLWTLDKAQKWCSRPEWIHLDTTPFASLLRNMGSLFGLGLGLHSPFYRRIKNTNAAFQMGCIMISLFLLQLLDGWTFSPENHMTFYILSFGKSVFALLIPTTLVPWALCRICKGTEVEKNL